MLNLSNHFFEVPTPFSSNFDLSHATAMEVRGMLTQPQLMVTVSTPKVRRSLNVLGVEFRFVNCLQRLFFGLADHWATKQEKVCVSDLERTIIDGLKRPEYSGGITEVAKGLRLRREDTNRSNLLRSSRQPQVWNLTVTK